MTALPGARSGAPRLLRPCHGHLRSSGQRIVIRAASYQTSSLRPTSAPISVVSTALPRGALACGHPIHQPRVDGRRFHIGSPNRTSSINAADVVKEPIVHDIFESKTGTWQYIVADPSTLAAVIIDPVLNYDAASQKVSTQTPDSLLSLVQDKGYRVEMILETHAHADHLTAAAYLQSRLAQVQAHRPAIGIGRRIGRVQKLFGQRYRVPTTEYAVVFDKLFEDDENFAIGDLMATVIHLPGHTPDHIGYKIGDNVFCGDTLFHADIGSARCDFPGGSANDLYKSLRKLLGYPEHVKIWTGHDYPPEGRGRPVPWMSVGDHRVQNKHIKNGTTEEEFVTMRKERDATLTEPNLLHQSLQTNIRAGRLPQPTESGQRMLHLPLKIQSEIW